MREISGSSVMCRVMCRAHASCFLALSCASRRDTIAYGTIPCIDLRKEDLDGPSSLVRMCVKID